MGEIMMPKKSYYDAILDDLKNQKNTYLDHHPSGHANYFCVVSDENKKLKPVIKSGDEIFAWAHQVGIEIPEWACTGQEADTRIVYELLEAKGLAATGSIFLTGRDNQLFLSSVAQSEAVKINGDFPFKGMYEKAKWLVRDYMRFLINLEAKHNPIWTFEEPLDQAVTRMAAYFDNIEYCYKFQDIRYVLLNAGWYGLTEGKWPISNVAILGFCSKSDPVLKEWIEDHPDFSYGKLYELAIQCRNNWEAEKCRIPEQHRFTEEFGACLKTMGRTFG